jgi:hypothetical protein
MIAASVRMLNPLNKFVLIFMITNFDGSPLYKKVGLDDTAD